MKSGALAVTASVLLLFGCGSPPKLYSAKDVKRAFDKAGVPVNVLFDRRTPLTAKQLENEGINVPEFAQEHVKGALLSSASEKKSSIAVLAFVFDSDDVAMKVAAAGRKVFPSVLKENERLVALVQKRNVAILSISHGRTSDSADVKRVQTAVAAL